MQPNVLDSFAVVAGGGGSIGTQAADVAFNIDLTARDVYGNVLSFGPNVFTGTVAISDTTTTVLPVVSGAFAAGLRTELVQVTQSAAGDVITVVSGGRSGASNAFAVVAGVLDHFTYTTQPGATYLAGGGIAVRIEARDFYDNLKVGYTQGVALSDTTGTVSEGSPNSGDTVITFSNGVYNNAVAANLFITQAQAGVTLTVTDGAVNTSSNAFTVQPAVLNRFAVEAGGGGNIGAQVADTAFNVRLTALDVYGNVLSTGANNYNGAGNTVTIGDSTGTIAPVVSGVFTAGVRTESVQVTLAQNNVQITVVDSATGLGSGTESGTSNSFNVGHGALAAFTVEAGSGGNIPDQIVSTGFNILITARDSVGNKVLSFTGAGATVDITNAPPILSMAPVVSGVFTSGVRTENVTITATAAGDQIRVTDSAGGPGTGVETGVSNGFNVDVNPSALAQFAFTTQPAGPYIAGNGIVVRVEAQDSVGNLITGFNGTATVSAWVGAVPVTIGEGAPGSGDVTLTFASGVYNNGLGATLYVTQAQAGIVIRVSRGGVSNDSGAFTVQPNVLDSFAVVAGGGGSIGTQAADVAFNIDLTARDVYGNVLSFGPNVFTGTVAISDTTTTVTAGGIGGVCGWFEDGVGAGEAVCGGGRDHGGVWGEERGEQRVCGGGGSAGPLYVHDAAWGDLPCGRRDSGEDRGAGLLRQPEGGVHAGGCAERHYGDGVGGIAQQRGHGDHVQQRGIQQRGCGQSVYYAGAGWGYADGDGRGGEHEQ